MPRKQRILILGDGRTGKRLQAFFGSFGMCYASVHDLPESAFARPSRIRGLVVCVDDIEGLAASLTQLGECFRRSRPFCQSPFPLVMLSARRNLPLHKAARRGAIEGCPVRIRCFAIPELAARRLLRRFPLHLAGDPAFGQSVHVLVSGFSDLGVAIALHVMRLAHYGTEPVCLTIASDEPEKHRSQFFEEFPESPSVAQIQFVERDLSALETAFPVTAAYCCDFEAGHRFIGLDRLRQVLKRVQISSPPIFVEVGDRAMSDVITEWDGQTYPFSAFAESCEPSALFDDSEDDLAVIVHEYYRDSIAAQGRPFAGNPAAEPWNRLDESYRQASRHQADHMAAKAAAIDCRFVPEEESEFFVFYPREVEQLARIEHERWSADRYLNGWKYGPLRDNENKIHPELIPYDQLSEPMKDLDRYTVRLMPALLGRKGLAIRRNLIVALLVAGDSASKSIRGADSIFERLIERYPDRTLVLAIDPADACQRFLAKQAVEHHRGALWSLLGDSIDRLLTGHESESQRVGFLEILAWSERRIPLTGPEEITRWMRTRADVVMILQPNFTGRPAGEGRQDAAFADLRRVWLDPESGTAGWSFEY
ncbi:MAG: RyR domain-containing protein [Gammaproteobacteria bacterium]